MYNFLHFLLTTTYVCLTIVGVFVVVRYLWEEVVPVLDQFSQDIREMCQLYRLAREERYVRLRLDAQRYAADQAINHGIDRLDEAMP